MEVSINAWAVVLGTVFSMGLGFLWFGPLFAKPWAKFAKVSKEQMDNFNPFAMMGALVGSILVSYVLAHMTFLSYTFFGETFLSSALTTAFWVFIGFQLFIFIMHDSFEGRRKKLTLINAGYEFVRIVGVALIIGFMGV